MKGQLVILIMAAFVVATTAAAYAIITNLPPILPAGQRSVSLDGAAFEVHGASHPLGATVTFTLANGGNYSLEAPCGLVIERLEGRQWRLVAPAPRCPGEPPRLAPGQSMDFSWEARSPEPLGDLAPVLAGQYRAIAKVEQLDTAWSLIVGFTLS